MKFFRFTTLLCVLCIATLTGCDNDVEVETHDGDDTAAVRDTDNTNNTGDTSNALGNAGQEAKDESVEKMVEAALIAKPGYADVTVESQPDGVIVLNGSVASENEKAQAQVIAENTSGVKKVTNNIMVKK